MTLTIIQAAFRARVAINGTSSPRDRADAITPVESNASTGEPNATVNAQEVKNVCKDSGCLPRCMTSRTPTAAAASQRTQIATLSAVHVDLEVITIRTPSEQNHSIEIARFLKHLNVGSRRCGLDGFDELINHGQEQRQTIGGQLHDR